MPSQHRHKVAARQCIYTGCAGQAVQQQAYGDRETPQDKSAANARLIMAAAHGIAPGVWGEGGVGTQPQRAAFWDVGCESYFFTGAR